MTNAEIIDRVNRWQRAGHVHELTCGLDTCRGTLRPLEEDGRVLLVCMAPDCPYVQEHIPQAVLDADLPTHVTCKRCMKSIRMPGIHTCKGPNDDVA